MHLESLKIISTDGNLENLKHLKLIREIQFKEGLNLIVDNERSRGDGNSLGKTTLLHIIDLCLGADDITKLYKAKETKLDNNSIKAFLDANFIVAELKAFDITIVRPLFKIRSVSDRIIINNQLYKLKDACKKLNEEIFSNKDNSPTFRQLIGKFIRIDDKEMSSLLSYFNSYTKKEDKAMIRKYLFGFLDCSLMSEKSRLKMELRNLNRNFKHVKKLKKNELEQLEKRSESILTELENKSLDLNKLENIEELIMRKSDIDNQYVKLKNEIDDVNYRIICVNENIKILNNQVSSVDESILRIVYKDSEKYFEANKKFVQLVEFHNKMIDNEKVYMNNRLIELSREKEQNEDKLKLILEERYILKYYEEQKELIAQITKESEDLGKIKEQLRMVVDYTNEKDRITNQLDSLSTTDSIEDDFEKKLEVFNRYFSEYCKKINNQKPDVLFSDDGEGVAIKSEHKRGAGGQASTVIAFDLAYMSFVKELNLDRPLFQIHDRIELVDVESKRSAFLEILPNIDGQLIVPTLSSTLVELGENFLKENTILELSQDSKLFRIEEFDGMPKILEGEK